MQAYADLSARAAADPVTRRRRDLAAGLRPAFAPAYITPVAVLGSPTARAASVTENIALASANYVTGGVMIRW